MSGIVGSIGSKSGIATVPDNQPLGFSELDILGIDYMILGNIIQKI